MRSDDISHIAQRRRLARAALVILIPIFVVSVLLFALDIIPRLALIGVAVVGLDCAILVLWLRKAESKE